MKKEKTKIILLIIGILLMNVGLLINRFVSMPDFYKGLIYGIGLGLIILFIAKNRKTINARA